MGTIPPVLTFDVSPPAQHTELMGVPIGNSALAIKEWSHQMPSAQYLAAFE